jgi:hypothetical protein
MLETIILILGGNIIIGTICYLVGFMDGTRVANEVMQDEAADLRMRLFTGRRL